MPDIKLSYVICTTVRSGSWMLCSALAKTGIAGEPAEYFGQTLWEELMNNKNRLSLDSTVHFMDRVRALSTTENGVFGTKLPANHAGMFLRRAAEHQNRALTSFKEAIETEFPHTRYVWLTRDDKAAQAVSLYKAVMTGQWRREEGSDARQRDLAYDQFGIERCYQDITASDRYWERFFAFHALTPVHVTYEDLVGRYDSTVRTILHDLGLPWHVAVNAPSTLRQADERSREWTERFKKQGRFPVEEHLDPERLWAPF